MINYYHQWEEKVLKNCQKPGRYIGGELLSTKKRLGKSET